MTMAQMADIIIVCSFFGIVGSAAGTIIGKGLCWVMNKIKMWRKKRRGKMQNE